MSDGGRAPASALRGVRIGSLTRHDDVRGAFTELWRASSFGALPADLAGAEHATFVQANLSFSATGVLRGLHCHLRQLDHWTVLAGRAFVALVDIRPVIADPVARPSVETHELRRGDTVTIPVGVAHGFLALEPLELLYLVTNEYDGSDELGFAWDDPAVGVPWPVLDATPDGRPILSERDRSNPTLAELATRIRAATSA